MARRQAVVALCAALGYEVLPRPGPGKAWWRRSFIACAPRPRSQADALVVHPLSALYHLDDSGVAKAQDALRASMLAATSLTAKEDLRRLLKCASAPRTR